MLWSLIVGFVAGWIANMVIKGGGYGLIANIILGVIGALMGAWIAELISFDGVSLIWLTVWSAVGAIVVLTLVALITRRALKRDMNE